MALPQRILLRWVAVGCAVSIAACAPSFDDTRSLAALKDANEAVVFIKLAYNGTPCRTGNIALATEVSPGRLELHKTLMVGGITGSAALDTRQVSLPAGTYHIGYVQCQALLDSGYMMGVGEQDGSVFIGNPRQSLARFTISAGEVVNVGQINLVPTDYLANTASISVTDVSSDTMQRLRAGVPNLSSTLITRLMTTTSPGQPYKIERVKLGTG